MRQSERQRTLEELARYTNYGDSSILDQEQRVKDQEYIDKYYPKYWGKETIKEFFNLELKLQIQKDERDKYRELAFDKEVEIKEIEQKIDEFMARRLNGN